MRYIPETPFNTVDLEFGFLVPLHHRGHHTPKRKTQGGKRKKKNVRRQKKKCVVIYSGAYIYIYIFCIPFVILALLSPSLPTVTQIRGDIAGPPPPLPTTVRAFIFIASRIQHFLLRSTLVELYLPTLLGALSS